MAQDKLSRHEELRYEYLLGNLEYLNPQQKEELVISIIKADDMRRYVCYPFVCQ